MQGRRTTTAIAKGLSHHRAGRLDEAAKKYRQVLTDDPRQPDALHLLGVVAQTIGQLDEAVELISESLRVNPDNVPAINNLAGVLKEQARYPEAIEFYEAALAVAPTEPYIHSNLGDALRVAGRMDEAASSLRRAIELGPDSFAAHNNLGSVLEAQGQLAEATACFRRAFDLNPDSHETLTNLGVSLRRQGKFSEAEDSLRRALDLKPRSDAALANLGCLMVQQGRIPEAFVTLQLALDVNPRCVVALINMGCALKDMGRFSTAVECFEKALALEPTSHLANNNLGTVLNELGRAAEAAAAFRRALELNPAYDSAHSNLLFTLQYLPDIDPAERFALHCAYDQKFASYHLAKCEPHKNSRDAERRLRVGYVSGDFRNHPVAAFIAPVFAGHRRENFEVFCYANHFVSDSMTARLQGMVEHWRDVASLSDDSLADRIRRDGIDILVDLSGHTAWHRLLTFARKPAPVQVTMIGYMQTTGLSAMDYRITDVTLDPPGGGDRFNTEKLVRLPAGAATFQPPTDCPPVNDLPAISRGHVTFATFNNAAKVTPEVIDAWAAILNAMPDSHLLAVGRSGNSVKPLLVTRGIAGERIEAVDRLPLLPYLSLHHRCDVLLDTFPYNGGTTSLYALWMGVPFITVDGANTTGRAGGGMLRPLGLDQLIATDATDYVRRAIDAASDLPRLAEWRRTLRSRLEPLLGGGDAYTRQLEAAFREMWRNWCTQKPNAQPQP